MESLHMRPVIKKHCLTLLLSGTLLCFSAVFLMYISEHGWLFLLLMLFPAIYLSWHGFKRWLEPDIGLTLSVGHIQYHHRHGGWALPWQEIQSIGVPRQQVGLDWQPLDYLGVRVRNYTAILDRISPDLINSLISEQRDLIDIGMSQEEFSVPYDGTLLYDDTPVVLQQEIYTGTEAMLLNRMRHCRRLLGYDLYIPITALDRSAQEVITLSRSYREHAERSAYQYADGQVSPAAESGLALQHLHTDQHTE